MIRRAQQRPCAGLASLQPEPFKIDPGQCRAKATFGGRQHLIVPSPQSRLKLKWIVEFEYSSVRHRSPPADGFSAPKPIADCVRMFSTLNPQFTHRNRPARCHLFFTMLAAPLT